MPRVGPDHHRAPERERGCAEHQGKPSLGETVTAVDPAHDCGPGRHRSQKECPRQSESIPRGEEDEKKCKHAPDKAHIRSESGTKRVHPRAPSIADNGMDFAVASGCRLRHCAHCRCIQRERRYANGPASIPRTSARASTRR